jgi:hypothetical protein
MEEQQKAVGREQKAVECSLLNPESCLPAVSRKQGRDVNRSVVPETVGEKDCAGVPDKLIVMHYQLRCAPDRASILRESRLSGSIHSCGCFRH